MDKKSFLIGFGICAIMLFSIAVAARIYNMQLELSDPVKEMIDSSSAAEGITPDQKTSNIIETAMIEKQNGDIAREFYEKTNKCRQDMTLLKRCNELLREIE